MEITRYVSWQSIDADMTRSRSDRCPSACWKPAQPRCWLAWMLEAGPAESPDVGPAGIGNSPLGSVHAGRPGSGIRPTRVLATRPTRVWVCRQAGLARPDSAQADIFGFFLICLRIYCYFFPLATLTNLQSWVPGIASPTDIYLGQNPCVPDDPEKFQYYCRNHLSYSLTMKVQLELYAFSRGK